MRLDHDPHAVEVLDPGPGSVVNQGDVGSKALYGFFHYPGQSFILDFVYISRKYPSNPGLGTKKCLRRHPDDC
jgi:hypothetical protein